MTGRIVEPELLDQLPPGDPRAIASRRDLRRLNACMGNARTIAHSLASNLNLDAPCRIADLGAGDACLLLRVIRRLASPGLSSFHLTLIDRRPVVSPQTRRAFGDLGCRLEIVPADVLDWLAPSPQAPRYDAILANLLLHHFTNPVLSQLLAAAAQHTRFFVAVEPRRSALSLLASRLVLLIGCNSVTRHDAPISVRAGFADQELSALWPAQHSWRLHESRAGLFSQFFLARLSP